MDKVADNTTETGRRADTAQSAVSNKEIQTAQAYKADAVGAVDATSAVGAVNDTEIPGAAGADVAVDAADLLRENRSLKRQLRNLDALLQRNRSMLAARDSVNALISAQREKMENTMNLLLENSPDIILLFDHDGKFTYCTNAFSTITGITDTSLVIGRHFADVFNRFSAPLFVNTLEEKHRNAVEQQQTVEFRGEIDFRGAGNTRIYNISITPMLVDGGVPEGAMMLFHDLNDIIKAKEAAEEASSVKTSFLATMSHEMRTPLNAITGMLHIARAAVDEQQLEDALKKIGTASTHLLGVINDILDMSKIEYGRLELTEDTFKFDSVLTGADDAVMYRIEEKHLIFEKTIDPEIPEELFGDKARLTQVVANLLSNAVKFTPEGGKIDLAVRRGERKDNLVQLIFEVTDSGIGVSNEQQHRLFKPFVQADNSVARRYGGTGLGLVISKNIVELMKGEIGVESKSGEGSRFFFHVWLKESDTSADENQKTQAEEIDYTGLFSERRILLADDIDINQEIIIALLEPTGVQIDVAYNGREAYECYSARPEETDLILMDINMPEVNGYQAVEWIRSSGLPGSEAVPIIAMTANVFQEDIEHCLDVGMNGHVGKPIELEELLEVLRKFIV